MGTTSQKLEYLNDTKNSLKSAINNLGGAIDSNTTFRNYANVLNDIYSNLPKVSDTGTNVSLSPTLKGRLGIVPKGNTYQDGEPTPDTPVEIQSATGTQNVVVSGKNLFDKDNANILNAPISSTVGSIASSPQIYQTIYIPCKANTTYTISKLYDTTKNRFVVGYTNEIPVSGTTIYGGITDNTKDKITITTGSDALYLIAYVWITGSTSTYQEMLDSIQIEANSTATPYQPYQEPQEVDIELSSRNKWDEEWEQGYYNANGNPVGNTENAIRSKNFIPVLPETNIYYYNGTNNGGRICFYDNNKNFISTITNSNAIRTTTANCYYIMFSTSKNYGRTYNNDIYINIRD